MKRRLAYLIFIFSGFSFQGNKPDVTRWVITSDCYLKVDGSTNINNFSCAINNYSNPDTIIVVRNRQPLQQTGHIQLDVQHFNCGNPVMTADLRKTLKVKDFPKLFVSFISLNAYPQAGSRQDVTKGIVLIELAGVAKRFEVDYKVITADNVNIHLVGTRKITFSDFNLTAPRKLGGMIRTNDELSVEFSLKMKVLD